MSSAFDVHIYASINCYIVPYAVDAHMSEYLRVSHEKTWMAGVLSYSVPSSIL